MTDSYIFSLFLAAAGTVVFVCYRQYKKDIKELYPTKALASQDEQWEEVERRARRGLGHLIHERNRILRGRDKIIGPYSVSDPAILDLLEEHEILWYDTRDRLFHMYGYGETCGVEHGTPGIIRNWIHAVRTFHESGREPVTEYASHEDRMKSISPEPVVPMAMPTRRMNFRRQA